MQEHDKDDIQLNDEAVLVQPELADGGGLVIESPPAALDTDAEAAASSPQSWRERNRLSWSKTVVRNATRQRLQQEYSETVASLHEKQDEELGSLRAQVVFFTLLVHCTVAESFAMTDCCVPLMFLCVRSAPAYQQRN